MSHLAYKKNRLFILIYKLTGQVFSDPMQYDEALGIAQNNNDLEMVEFIIAPKGNIDYSVLSQY